jgi:hypothetical protein
MAATDNGTTGDGRSWRGWLGSASGVVVWAVRAVSSTVLFAVRSVAGLVTGLRTGSAV